VRRIVGFFTRKRQLVLTDGPRLFYIDPDKMIVKGEIPWGRDMAIEFKNDKLFIITVVRLECCPHPRALSLMLRVIHAGWFE